MEVPAKFVKLMMLTTSESDNEALVALRKANALLAEANVNWEEFLTAVSANAVAPSASRSRPPRKDDDGFSDIGRDAKGHYIDADDINMLFEQAYAKTRPGGSFREFLDSVHIWWEGNGFLTEKQYAAIRRAALR
jgi:NACalpha-BTF3-like transcription factor